MKVREMEFKKGSLVTILGSRGTGKTYLLREIIKSTKSDAVVFDTIGAIGHVKNVRTYKFDPKQQFNQQIQILSQIIQKTNRNIGINLSECTQAEIVKFSDALLKITPMDYKVCFYDEFHDYASENVQFSAEVERIARHGRNFGTTIFLDSQRPQTIKKNVLDLSSHLIVFRLNFKNELDVLKNLLNNIKVDNVNEELSQIALQKVGQYKLYSLA